MATTDLEQEWRRELDRLGASEVRRALMHAGFVANVDREFARAWLRAHDDKLLRRILRWERVRTVMLAIAAAASIVMTVEALLEWLL